MQTAAIEAFKTADEANKKHIRNIRKCEWLSYHKGPDPFLIHADLLARLKADADQKTARWTAIASRMDASEIVGIITAAQAA